MVSLHPADWEDPGVDLIRLTLTLTPQLYETYIFANQEISTAFDVRGCYSGGATTGEGTGIVLLVLPNFAA